MRGVDCVVSDSSSGVGAPAFQDCLHILGHRALEVHTLVGRGVLEAEDEGVERLTRHGGEADVDELLVF